MCHCDISALVEDLQLRRNHNTELPSQANGQIGHSVHGPQSLGPASTRAGDGNQPPALMAVAPLPHHTPEINRSELHTEDKAICSRVEPRTSTKGIYWFPLGIMLISSL